MNTDSFKDVLNKFMPDDNSISLLADYLGYEVGKNPLDPDGEWKIPLFLPTLCVRRSVWQL